jgi:hypothetical protein
VRKVFAYLDNVDDTDELRTLTPWKIHIEPAGLSVTDAAKALNVSRPALTSLLNSKAGLSGEMALRSRKRSV